MSSHAACYGDEATDLLFYRSFYVRIPRLVQGHPWEEILDERQEERLILINLEYRKREKIYINPSNAKAIFVQSTKTQRFLKTILDGFQKSLRFCAFWMIQTLSCWYSMDSLH